MSTNRAEKILSLQLEWIRASDAKIPSLFAVNIAMLGVIAALTKTLSSWTIFGAIFTVLCLIPLVLSVAFLVFAMFPQLNGPKKSNIFFGGIVKKTESTYIAEVKKISDVELEEDLLSQAYRNAEIANSKYINIKLAFVSLFASAPCWLIAIYFLYV